ncbi:MULTISPECIES: helix-turn-helix domain-containing protein [unclassified Knoellia]|uniref:helix-turn-helix domain-containing protein n=1 Tax=Knoellia altitudinis TaxID=3404795 RepID=UPI00361932FE
MTVTTTSDRIRRAREAAGISQRALEEQTGINQATLSRIESGARPAKMNEILSLSWALGCTVAELTGRSNVRERVECAARAGDAGSMEGVINELTFYLELAAYLEDQGIPRPA